jgi:hypothetical protein
MGNGGRTHIRASAFRIAALGAIALTLGTASTAQAENAPWDEPVISGAGWALLYEAPGRDVVVYQSSIVAAAGPLRRVEERYEYKNVQYPSFFSMTVEAAYDCDAGRRQLSRPTTYSLRNLEGVRQRYPDVGAWETVSPEGLGAEGLKRACSA